MSRLAGSIAAVAALGTVASAVYDNFNIKRDHPLCSFNEDVCNAPVVLSKFHFLENDGDLFLSNNAYYIPGVASYRKSGSPEDLYSDADAFVVKWMHNNKASDYRNPSRSDNAIHSRA